jgi:hypothetical protein
MDFAELIFLKNINDNKVEVTLPSLECAYDLFCFCLNMTILGLRLIKGEDKVTVDSIDADTINLIGRKLKNVGIELSVLIQPCPPELLNVHIYKKEGEHMGNDIRDFAFIIHSGGLEYVISFVLSINTADLTIPPNVLL